jgi:hypothetical protein
MYLGFDSRDSNPCPYPNLRCSSCHSTVVVVVVVVIVAELVVVVDNGKPSTTCDKYHHRDECY